MIGHYLLTLTPEQEDRVLTSTLVPGVLVRSDGRRCLLGVCEDWQPGATLEGHEAQRDDALRRRLHLIAWQTPDSFEDKWLSAPHRYDTACGRFGAERVNAAIRNRILANQARRTLAPQLEAVGA